MKKENVPFEFRARLKAAELVVKAARAAGDKLALASALKELGNIKRRWPQLREDSNETYSEAAELYRELQMPLEAAWVIRHIGINHEYAERLADAEKYYDESLEVFRMHASEDDRNYANTRSIPRGDQEPRRQTQRIDRSMGGGCQTLRGNETTPRSR